MVCKCKLKLLCVYWVHQRVFSLQFETLLQTFIVKFSKETYDRFQHFDQLAFTITKLQFHLYVPFLIFKCQNDFIYSVVNCWRWFSLEYKYNLAIQEIKFYEVLDTEPRKHFWNYRFSIINNGSSDRKCLAFLHINLPLHDLILHLHLDSEVLENPLLCKGFNCL